MFADPQTVTVNAVPHTLARVGSGLDTGVFKENTGEYALHYQHTYNRRVRRLVRLAHSKLDADLLDPTINVPYAMSTHLVVDLPTQGYDILTTKTIVDGFLAYLTASSGAAVTKLLGGES